MDFPGFYYEKFEEGAASNQRFWERLGGMPALEGKSVLDVGCGWGRLCVDMALAGARRVVGIDIGRSYIDFDNEYIFRKYPQLAGTLEFHCLSLEQWHTDEQFDIVVSKDSFEHIMDLPLMMREIRAHLKPGGRLYAGFGPLWNSPYGDHHETRSITPWGHLLKSDERIIRILSRDRRREIRSIEELGQNRHSLADYRRIILEAGFRVVQFRTNQNPRPVARIMNLLSKLPLLEEYFTFNVYCILEKPA